MIGCIRRQVRENERLYLLYLWIVRGRFTEWPNKETDCHLTGFPRSANTYARYIVTNAFPDRKFVTHIHSTASLKAALRYRVKTSVIVRNPLDSVVSQCIKLGIRENETAKIGSVLTDNVLYHRFVLAERSHISILDFARVTGDSVSFLKYMARLLGVAVSAETLERNYLEALEKIKKKEKRKASSGSSLPRQSRNEMKRAYSLLVRKNSLFGEAMRLYRELMSCKTL